MTALPLLCVAYAFTSLGFCLGFVASAVLSGTREPRATPQELPE